jgi:hypothetical protein
MRRLVGVPSIVRFGAAMTRRSVLQPVTPSSHFTGLENSSRSTRNSCLKAGRDGAVRQFCLKADRHRLGSANKRVPELGGKSDKLFAFGQHGMSAVSEGTRATADRTWDKDRACYAGIGTARPSAGRLFNSIDPFETCAVQGFCGAKLTIAPHIAGRNFLF